MKTNLVIIVDDNSSEAVVDGSYERNRKHVDKFLQKVWFKNPDKKYPVEAMIEIDRLNNPWPVGEYFIDSSSINTDYFDQLVFGVLKLVPLSDKKAA